MLITLVIRHQNTMMHLGPKKTPLITRDKLTCNLFRCSSSALQGARRSVICSSIRANL